VRVPRSTRIRVFFLSAVVPTVVALAQTFGGGIGGTITDPSGKSIAGAAITIQNVSTGLTWKLISSTTGLYSAHGLPVGNYSVTVNAAGFASAKGENVEIQEGSERVFDIQLSIGESSQTVTVNAEESALDSASSEVSAVNGGYVVRELPLNGRDWTTLASLQPGVAIVSTENTVALGVARANRGLGVMMAIGGARPEQTSFELDGINVTDYAGGGPASVLGLSLGVDAIEEFSVITENAPAPYGRTSGGVIDATTRAGSNQFHGSIYEFLRNNVFDARNFFDGSSVPPFRKNQFGATFSGPIKPQKTFFFFNYEGIRQSLGVTTVSIMPSPQARQGHLVAGSVTVSPLVVPYLAFFPLPNGPITGDVGTYSLVTQDVTNESFATARGDHHFSDRDFVHMTWLFDSSQTSGPDAFGGLLLGTFAQRQMASVEESHVFTPATVNIVRIGFNRVSAEQVQALSAINPLADEHAYGFLPGRDVGEISIAGLTTYPGGVGSQGEYLFHYTSFQADDNFALTKGNHSIRAGVAAERIESNTLGAGNDNGEVSFGSLQSFLTDQPSSFEATLPNTNIPESLRQDVAGTYFQDDWHIRRNLTINLGLRYEIATVPTEEHDLLGTLITGSQQLKTGSPYFRNPSLRNFAPRVGLAWSPSSDHATTIRAAFGQYDALPLTSQFSLLSVISAPFNVQESTASVPVGSFPDGLYQSLSAGGPRADFIQQNPKRIYVLQWNVMVERRLTPTLLVEAGYAGSHGVHLPLVAGDINTVPPSVDTPLGYIWPTPRGSGEKPWPAWGNVTAVMWEVSSTYNSLPVRVQKHLSRGLFIQGSYTWSKSLDSGSNSLQTAYTNTLSNLPVFDPRLTKGPSDFDTPQHLAISGTWELPSPRFGGRPLRAAAQGWQIGTALQASSGLPFTPTIAGDPLGLNSSIPYDFPDRLDLSGCGNPVNPGNPNSYIKLSCFAAPDPSTRLGDAGRNIARGPGLENLDTSLVKNARVSCFSESCRLQFRVEAFNVLNHTNLLPPTAASAELFTQSLTSIASAGKLTATSTPSRQLQLALKVVW
jgi:Carboxypeptidase regulatory-like domain/TonB dependent receptor